MENPIIDGYFELTSLGVASTKKLQKYPKMLYNSSDLQVVDYTLCSWRQGNQKHMKR